MLDIVLIRVVFRILKEIFYVSKFKKVNIYRIYI